MCHVDTNSIDTAVKPEAQVSTELCLNFLIVPIQIWLGLVEDVEVPPTGSVARSILEFIPRWTTKDTDPVIRWQSSISLSTQQVVARPRTLSKTSLGWDRRIILNLVGECFNKPRVFP